MTRTLEGRLKEQIRYYRARADQYDAWADRAGPYDRGSDNKAWFAEKDRLGAALRAFHASGDVLEIAGGTGQWTEQLVRSARSLTVIDAAAEALDHNERRLGADVRTVTFEHGDFFTWDPPKRFDVVFFSYWLSHVPPELFEVFWERVGACLAPGGRVFLIDNIASEQAERLDPEIPAGDGVSVIRPAPDGHEYRVWKVLWQPNEFRHALAALGWSFEVTSTGSYFMWAEGARTTEPGR